LTGLDNSASFRPGTEPRNLEIVMAMAYWVATYRSIKNPDGFAAYAKLAAPAIQAAGGRFLARGMPAKTYEAGIKERVVLIEFDSVAQAITAHDGPAYQAALKALGDAADRDIRIVEGVG
jgi:uncharacterized protein (DUF1330 family)